MQEKIRNLIKGVVGEDVHFVVEHPSNLSFGDYSTNAGIVSKKGGELFQYLEKNKPEEIEKVEEKNGFINFYLTQKFFAGSVEEILNAENFGENKLFAGQKIMVEYTDPNPFKPFHIGHLMTNAIGESVARILEHSGADVSRANYQGDVGLHVAKAMYGMQKAGTPDMSASNASLANYIGESYAMGSNAYENDEGAKLEIESLNKRIYDRSDPEVNQVYDWGFKVTMEAFEDIYRILGTKFDFYFLESKVAELGVKVVKDNEGKIFEKSDGAIVFKAEIHDPKLHTRVFITSAGLPTYETKELGLTEEKFKVEPNMDKSIVITAQEQADYMRVVAKAISLIHPQYENKMLHITHGMMRLSTGKMGSRKGNVITGEALLNETINKVAERLVDKDWAEEEKEKIAQLVGVAAIKYSILRSKAGSDIVYDVDESISTEGDSGPYLQYSYVRANSVIEKAKKENILPDFEILPEETSIVEKLLYRFPEVVYRSAQLYEPHHIANYLIETARAYNSFYGNNTIVDKADKTSPYKVALSFAFSFVMKKGLHLLGIGVPEKM